MSGIQSAMRLFGRKPTDESASEARPSTAPPSNPPRAPPPATVRFEIDASFHITGIGEVLVGRVTSGTITPGMSLRLWQSKAGSVHDRSVRLNEVTRRNPERSGLTGRARPIPLTEAAAGPESLSLVVSGIENGVARKGDSLFA